jgi:hypothetical protein
LLPTASLCRTVQWVMICWAAVCLFSSTIREEP